MHDLPLNQAVGLMGLAAPAAPQLLAVVAHGDPRTQQRLLWQLSSALTELGYGVTVLDTTQAESANNPGLQQLLDYDFGPGTAEDHGPAWHVLPAAMGMQTLCGLGNKPANSLQRLGQVLYTNGVILLYASVENLVTLLSGSDIRPLLSVPCDKRSLLSSYLALKRLLRTARLEPTILNMIEDTQIGESSEAAGIARALSECARNFLAYEVNAIHIDPSKTEQQLSAPMRHLASRLLEKALALRGPMTTDSHFQVPGYREARRSH